MSEFATSSWRDKWITTCKIYGDILANDLESHNIGWLIESLAELKSSMPVSAYEKQNNEVKYILTNHKYLKDDLECTEQEHKDEMDRLRKEYNEQSAQL